MQPSLPPPPPSVPLPFSPLYPVTLRRPCVSSCIVSRKQKTGSLCPAFKSTQSSVSSAPPFPRPPFSFRLPYIPATLFRSSSLFFLAPPISLLPSYFRAQLLSLLFPSRARHPRVFFSVSIILLFSYPCIFPLLTLTRSNSRLHLSPSNSSHSIRSYNSVYRLIPLVSCTRALSSVPARKVSGMKFRVAMSKSSSSQYRPKKHRKFPSPPPRAPHTNKYSFVYVHTYCDISHGM